jgi:hypothetical protein
MPVKPDRRFNRYVTQNARIPVGERGSLGIGSTPHEGSIKCRLAHANYGSVVVPDFLFVGKRSEHWLQPLSFGPPVLSKLGDEIRCQFSVDIAGGHRLRVDFSNSHHLHTFVDGSELYKCTLYGPSGISPYYTGTSRLVNGHAPFVKLYHHTSKPNKKSIRKSAEFWPSSWNIQGTEKKILNIGYVYFTPLPRIAHTDDLKLIAMASEGEMYFIVDDFEPPSAVTQEIIKANSNKILRLPVYRASTHDRTERLVFEVETTLLNAQHLLRHAPQNQQVWYEVITPFIQRIGLVPGAHLKFNSHVLTHTEVPAKRFDYVVIGDARNVDGLAAPFNEEETSHIVKFEPLSKEPGLLRFWFKHKNTDQYSAKNVEMAQFTDGSKPKS